MEEEEEEMMEQNIIAISCSNITGLYSKPFHIAYDVKANALLIVIDRFTTIILLELFSSCTRTWNLHLFL